MASSRAPVLRSKTWSSMQLRGRRASPSSPTATCPWIWTPSRHCPGRHSACSKRAPKIDGHYVLEVSSPGVDRPLTTEKHFRRARGHTADVTLTDGSALTVRLGDVIDGQVRVVVRGDRGAKPAVREIPLGDIASAVVRWSLPGRIHARWNSSSRGQCSVVTRRAADEHRYGRVACDRGGPWHLGQ